MSKNLILIRHGDAEPLSSDSPNSDISRGLTPIGISKVHRIANILKLEKLNFQRIISSFALRTKETSRILAQGMNFNLDLIEFYESLYNCDINAYFKIVEGLDNSVENIIFVGHSPSITEFGEYVVGKPIGHLQQGGIIYIKLNKDDSWMQIHNREGKLKFAKNFLHDTLKLA